MPQPLPLPDAYDAQAHLLAHTVGERVFHATIQSAMLANWDRVMRREIVRAAAACSPRGGHPFAVTLVRAVARVFRRALEWARAVGIVRDLSMG